MFGWLGNWYDGVVGRALAKQEAKLREELEETKRLPKTPERDKLIADVEVFLASGSTTDADAYVGSKIAATKADLTALREDIALDSARVERKRLADRVDKLAELSKRL